MSTCKQCDRHIWDIYFNSGSNRKQVFYLKSIQNVNVHDNTFKSKKNILYDNPNMCENNSMKNIQF